MDRIRQELQEYEMTLKLALLNFKILLLLQQIGSIEQEQLVSEEPFFYDENDYDCSRLTINNNNIAQNIAVFEKSIREKRHSLIKGALEVLKKDHTYKDKDFLAAKMFIFEFAEKQKDKEIQHLWTCKLRSSASSPR